MDSNRVHGENLSHTLPSGAQFQDVSTGALDYRISRPPGIITYPLVCISHVFKCISTYRQDMIEINFGRGATCRLVKSLNVSAYLI
jgi:hypothetical protein